MQCEPSSGKDQHHDTAVPVWQGGSLQGATPALRLSSRRRPSQRQTDGGTTDPHGAPGSSYGWCQYQALRMYDIPGNGSEEPRSPRFCSGEDRGCARHPGDRGLSTTCTLKTNNKTLVECSFDRIWGNEIPLGDRSCMDRQKWYSVGILGEMLMEIRSQLRNQMSEMDDTLMDATETNANE